MSTYLELCQKVARESGTIAGVLPTAVTGQTGRLLKVVNWVNDAWSEIQNMHAAWLWMRSEFSNDLSTNTMKYTAASFNLTDFARWVEDPGSVTMYLTATGVSDEGELENVPYDQWRRTYDRGTQTANRPTQWTVTPSLEFAVGVKPDLVYTVRGEYYLGNQALAANGDTPNCPARFHDLIVWKALMKLYASDEATEQLEEVKDLYEPLLFALVRDQLPAVMISASSTLA